jgi:signal transduction histidine kinase/ActR/RegA family two-component response regulator
MDAQVGLNLSATPDIGRRGGIVRRYFLIFATLVGGALVASVLVEMVFRFQETRQNLAAEHSQMAELAGLRIQNYIESVAQAIRFAQPESFNQARDRVTDDYVLKLRLLLKHVPAIRDLVVVGLDGREQLRVSRIGPSVPDAQVDHSSAPYLTSIRAGQTYFGPIIFPPDAFEPRILIAVPITSFATNVIGVLAAEVNVRYVWDVVQAIRVGKSGYAYVVSESGALVAHPDLHLVLQRRNLSDLPQVAALRSSASGTDSAGVYKNLNGQWVLESHVRIPNVGWTVLVERPLMEAFGPLLASLTRTGGILLIVCAMAVGAAVLLGRRVVRPIEILRRGATRLEAGNLEARLEVKTGDEFEELAEDFNRMAGRLQDSYATLERKVEERTHQLELANLAKSRFLAAASHDLRQPLHALGLFVAQLRPDMNAGERGRIVERVNASVAAMNELFNALLDISKLDAGALTPNVADFPIAQLLHRIEETFAEPAREKNLSLRVVPSDAWVRSDFILLERILLNLLSNAVRYTSRGGIVVGCRKRGDQLRIEVWDTGPGIAEDQRQNIFSEFYRVGDPERDQRAGLGLGLAIVERLCLLLGQPIELASMVGKGSRFTVVTPRVPARVVTVERPVLTRAAFDVSNDKLVVIIDDDPRVLDGMGGLLRSWGCRVVSGGTAAAAVKDLRARAQTPDLIISDYRLPDGKTGIEAIGQVCREFGSAIPAFLISGDTHSETLQEARARGLHLLLKPVDPMTLRAIVNRMLRQRLLAEVTS